MGSEGAPCPFVNALCAGGCYVVVKRELICELIPAPLDGSAAMPKRRRDNECPPGIYPAEAARGPSAKSAKSMDCPPGLFPKRLEPSLIDLEYAQAGRPCMRLDDAWGGRSFSLPMPPPNITGKLHLGHALDLGLQDALIRRASSRGAKASWIAGCDHAGQATHDKIMLAEPSLRWGSDQERSAYMDFAPVRLWMSRQMLGSAPVVFYAPCSDMQDYKMIENFLKAAMPGVPECNATNFGHCVGRWDELQARGLAGELASSLVDPVRKPRASL
jgi:hypothetical protein